MTPSDQTDRPVAPADPIPAGARWITSGEPAPDGLATFDETSPAAAIQDSFREGLEAARYRLAEQYREDVGVDLPGGLGGLDGAIRAWEWAAPRTQWRAASDLTDPAELPPWVSGYEYCLSDATLWLIDGLASLLVCILRDGDRVTWTLERNYDPEEDLRPVLTGSGWKLNPLARVRDLVLVHLDGHDDHARDGLAGLARAALEAAAKWRADHEQEIVDLFDEAPLAPDGDADITNLDEDGDPEAPPATSPHREMMDASFEIQRRARGDAVDVSGEPVRRRRWWRRR